MKDYLVALVNKSIHSKQFLSCIEYDINIHNAPCLMKQTRHYGRKGHMCTFTPFISTILRSQEAELDMALGENTAF